MQKTWRGATYWFALYCLFSLHPDHQPTNGPTHDGEYMGGNLSIEAKLRNTQSVCALKSLKYIKIHSVNLTDNVHRQDLCLVVFLDPLSLNAVPLACEWACVSPQCAYEGQRTIFKVSSFLSLYWLWEADSGLVTAPLCAEPNTTPEE